MLSCCGDSLLTLSAIYCDVISSVIIRESMTSHGHMTHQEKDRIFRGSGDEDLLTLSPIYCDVIARVRISQLTHNVFKTLLECCAELVWDKRCSNLVATFDQIYFVWQLK